MSEVDRFGRPPWLWITASVFAFDQLSKAFFQAELSIYQQIVVIPDLLSRILAYSTGATLSFLADSSGWQRWLSVLVTIVVSVILVAWLKHLKKGETWLAIALALVLGGALDNPYDRMVPGHAVDFILIHWQNRWYFPAFSLVDSAITADATMLAFDTFGSKKSGEATHG